MNTNNNKKNYKNDNSLNKEKYNKFLSDPIFSKSDKNLYEEYKDLVTLILSELINVQLLNPPITPTQFITLRKTYRKDQIFKKIRDLEQWDKIQSYHKLLPLLNRFLERETKIPKEEIPRDEVGIPRISLVGIFDTDGNTPKEIDTELEIYKDKINWPRFNIGNELWMRRYLSKWLRLCKYISESNLTCVKELKPLQFREFLTLTKKSETLLSLYDNEFDEVKNILRTINSWPNLNEYQTVARCILTYLKNEED